MRVKIVQTHDATVVQTDTYEVSDEYMNHLRSLSEADQERFIWNVGKEVESDTQIEDIHETTNVEVQL